MSRQRGQLVTPHPVIARAAVEQDHRGPGTVLDIGLDISQVSIRNGNRHLIHDN